jgi:hypothetical protein
VRKAVGLWLTGLAAAGLAPCVVSASGAAPENAARLAGWKCQAGDGVGAASRVTYQLKVNGASLDRAVLKPRDSLSTDPSGAADICLMEGKTACRIGSNAVVRVLPSKGVLLFVFRSPERVSCETNSGKSKKVKTPHATIVVGAPRRGTSALDRAGGTSKDVYYLTVEASETVVDVCSGTARVTRNDRPSKAVVVGRKGRITVRETRAQRTVRKLWGSGCGSFVTRGRYSEATVRG